MLWVGLRIGVYHTQFSVAYFLVSTLLSKMFDVGDRDLPVLTSGDWVIKGWVLKWPVNLRTFFTFLRFFQSPKKRDFLRFFLSGWPRFLEHWTRPKIRLRIFRVLTIMRSNKIAQLMSVMTRYIFTSFPSTLHFQGTTSNESDTPSSVIVISV